MPKPWSRLSVKALFWFGQKQTVCWIRCYYPLLIQLPMNFHLKWSKWLLLVVSQFMLWRDVNGRDWSRARLLTQILSISHQNHTEIMTGVIMKATLRVQLVPQTTVCEDGLWMNKWRHTSLVAFNLSRNAPLLNSPLRQQLSMWCIGHIFFFLNGCISCRNGHPPAVIRSSELD